MKNKLISLSLIALFFCCLRFSNVVICGAKDGLLLWYRTLLPTLLPIMILTKIMIRTDAATLLSGLFGPLFRIVPGVSKEASFAVITGLFCGCPTGASVTADLVRDGRISPSEGNYILAFCNNISPMFLSACVLTRSINDARLYAPLFVLLLLTPMICSQLFRFIRETFVHTCGKRQATSSLTAYEASLRPAGKRLSIEDCMMESFESIVLVGLFVMLFSIFIKFADILPLGTPTLRYTVFSMLEITNGLELAAKMNLPRLQRDLLVVFLSSFGGVCALFQTSSVLRGTGLSLCFYTIKKLIIACVTSFLSYFIFRFY